MLIGTSMPPHKKNDADQHMNCAKKRRGPKYELRENNDADQNILTRAY